jgi:NADH-quinone oxidoreductase subunit C
MVHSEVPLDLQNQALELVKTRFPEELVGTGAHAGRCWAEVKRGRIVEILRTLRDELGFNMLMDITCVDWLNQGKPERFSVVYELTQIPSGKSFRLHAWVPEDDPTIDSVIPVWLAADWGEREIFDMFGLRFNNHPNLKRILLPETYTGYPLRKDYPVIGRGERYDFPKHTR